MARTLNQYCAHPGDSCLVSGIHDDPLYLFRKTSYLASIMNIAGDSFQFYISTIQTVSQNLILKYNIIFQSYNSTIQTQ